MAGKVAYNIKKVVIPLVSILIFVIDILVMLVIQSFSRHILPVKVTNLQFIYDWTKRWFIDLLVTILEIVAPSKVRITTDNASIPKDTFKIDKKKNRIVSNMERNSISICNHQIYTDWVFLWWIAYTSKLGGRVYIMLKKSLQSIPILGYGMTNFKFIFMDRKWSTDQITLNNILKDIDTNARGQGPLHGKKPVNISESGLEMWPETTDSTSKKDNMWPYNLFLFPEGTNFTENTKKKSIVYGKKANKETFEHLLLPHSTGLRFSIQTLKPSLDTLYDVTIGYSGVNKDEFAEYKYGLKSFFLEGIYPKIVDIHFRAFNIDEIPLDDAEVFDQWLYKVWKEKDDLLKYYYANGTFNSDSDLQHSVIGEFKINTWELVVILAVPTITFLLTLRYILNFLFR